MEIEVEEYVRTKDGKIATFDRYSSRKETSIYKSPFNCFIKLPNRKTPLQCHRDYIVKHSKSIIDLIEVWDYVNGRLVLQTDCKTQNVCLLIPFTDTKVNTNIMWYGYEDIETILTKEQYQANCYTVERKE